MVDTALGIIHIPLDGSDGSTLRPTPVMVNVFPLLVCPYAIIVQLNPSIKCATKGSAVEVNRRRQEAPKGVVTCSTYASIATTVAFFPKPAVVLCIPHV